MLDALSIVERTEVYLLLPFLVLSRLVNVAIRLEMLRFNGRGFNCSVISAFIMGTWGVLENLVYGD